MDRKQHVGTVVHPWRDPLLVRCLPRDAVARCQYVRPSVTYYINMPEDIVKLLSQPRSTIIIVF